MEPYSVVAGAALILAMGSWWRAGQLKKAMEKAYKEMESLRSHVTASNNILERKIEDLGLVVQRRHATSSGGPAGRFTADMMVAEALALHPDAGAVMAQFHLGGCSSCSISENHVLGPAAESYGVDVNRLLAALNALLDSGGIPEKPSHREKLIQIEPTV
jgi:hybrid cluster-associated redox disulfide protein